MKKPHFFYNDLYFANIYFCPGFTREELSEAIKLNFDVEYDKDLTGCYGSSIEVATEKGGGVFVWIKNDELSPSSISVIAHEALHVTNMILSSASIQIDINSNDEAQAYLLGWIVKKILETYSYQLKEK